MKASTLLFLSFFLFFSTPLISQDALEQKLGELYTTIEAGNHPGVAIGIWKEGKVIFSKAYGNASLEHEIPFSPQTVSDIGSVAKQFTCYAIILLSEQGKLKLDDPINKYLDYIPDFGKPISIRHLMNHTSGLREIYSTEALRGGRSGDAIFQDDIIKLVKNQKELNFEPGSRYMYCNTAYALLAEIVESTGEMPFEDWMKENVFAPIGMNHTYIMNVQGEVFPKGAESYYKLDDNTYRKAFDNSTIRGQGGIYSSLDDMMKWLGHLAQMEKKAPNTFREMTRRGILNNGDTIRYASGLNVDKHRGLIRIEHGGASAGYRSLLSYFPEYDLGFVMKNNSPSINPIPAVQIIFKEFLEAHMEAESPRSNANTSEEEEKAAPTHSNLKAYTGKFYCPELQIIYDISLEDGALKGYHFRHGTFSLNHKEKDTFSTGRYYIPEISFELNKKKKVSGLKVSSGRALNIYFKKVDF